VLIQRVYSSTVGKRLPRLVRPEISDKVRRKDVRQFKRKGKGRRIK